MSTGAIALSLAGLSFMITVIWGAPLLRILRHFKIGKQIRVEGPERHLTKMGTPTMGGIMIVLPVVFMTALLNAAQLLGFSVLGRSVLLPLGVLVGFAALGAVDDWFGLQGRPRSDGLRARTKLYAQIALALVASIGIYYFLDAPQMYIPGVKGEVEIGIVYIPLAMFIIISLSNAVNLTDGLDGLAGLISATCFAAFGAIALLQGQIFLARFCFTLVGAIFGFLWFNVHPAELFMGDTGSQALGSTLAVVALMTGHWVLVPIIAIVPTSVVLSSLIQTTYFRYTRRRYGEGRRLFKMAPLHHHFELSGWSETQVVQRFWLIGMMAAMIGVALAAS
jgi:phospho-N-acetylmuramoyl-pentapeptide-transferase